jgi:hypothetical protein
LIAESLQAGLRREPPRVDRSGECFEVPLVLVSRCELVVLLAVIVNMVVKPTGNAGWFWGLLIAMLLGIAVVLAAYPRGPQPVAATATE